MNPSPRFLHVIPETFDDDTPEVGRITWTITLAKRLIARRDQGLVSIERAEMQAIADRSSFDWDTSASACSGAGSDVSSKRWHASIM